MPDAVPVPDAPWRLSRPFAGLPAFANPQRYNARVFDIVPVN
jgi:hypothetical protein